MNLRIETPEAPSGNRGWLPRLTVLICLLAPIAVLALTLREDYLRLRGADEYLFLILLLGPYLLLGLFARRCRRRLRDSAALFLLTVLLVGFGLWFLGAEAASYRAALAESSQGRDYMRDRYQRTILFIVPAVQWIVCLLVGVALFVGFCASRLRGHGVEPCQKSTS